MAELYRAAGETAEACRALGDAAAMIHGLAQGISDEALREHYLSGPQTQPVLRQAQVYASALSLPGS